jgi:hypothetical protein
MIAVGLLENNISVKSVARGEYLSVSTLQYYVEVLYSPIITVQRAPCGINSA